MLVYADHDRVEDPRAALGRIANAVLPLDAQPPSLERHSALVSLFIEAGELAQGLADQAFEANGEDDETPIDVAATALLMALARSVASSWDSGFQRVDTGPVTAMAAALTAQPLPSAIRMRRSEGYAFYALYPEGYLEAARHLSAIFSGPVIVIGVRSIGTGLAAIAATALKAAPPATLRPTGHPFRRELRISSRLEATLLADRAASYVIVDEGPGLSGSSFGAVADWLEARGVPRARIAFLPGHDGDLGPQACPSHRQRWAEAVRPSVPFDTLFRRPGGLAPPLERWFEDLLGPPVAPLQDMSGGGWRTLLHSVPAAWPPVLAWQERRKFLLRTTSGCWRLKFIGLGRSGADKLERARALHRAGFSPEPVTLRHGILVEIWLEKACPLSTATPDALRRLADYLIFRARHFPANGNSGARLTELLEMARVNVAEALGKPAAASLDRWPPEILGPLQARVRPIVTDHRLHRWEWLRTADGRLIKTDALDHASAHDLIGCQDVAWDVAGGIIEFGLSAADTAWLCDTIALEIPLNLDLVSFCIPCYLAFQIGYWSFAAPSEAAAMAQSRYKAEWKRRIEQPP